jgi:hypothetical protein
LESYSIGGVIEDNTIRGKQQMTSPVKTEKEIDIIVKFDDAKYKK